MSDDDSLLVPTSWRAHPVGESALLFELAAERSPAALDAVHAFFFALQTGAPPWLFDLHPAFTSVLVEFDAQAASHDVVEQFARALPSRIARPLARQTHVIPVRYGAGAPCDLDDVARACALSRDDVIERHVGSALTVAFLGFMPGFAYLLGLDEALDVPRLATPRAQVPRGAVAIAAGQAAVYPDAGPGGWRILGRAACDVAALPFRLGDAVRFEPCA